MYIRFNILILILYMCLVNIIKGNVIVETASGKIAGKEVKSIISDEKYFSFLGIPFAQPPVGALRFKAPVPHEGWNDVLEAKREKKPCAQYNIPSVGDAGYGFCGDEDCLYLSIHTPNLPRNEELKLPVIVFLYNENFKTSFNHSKDYSPDFFMKEDVIIVTVNHRLGALGFLAFADTILPGNHGLRDVILALQWLQKNIIYFGGDPFKVTLMGNQGGAVLVDILMHSSKAKGLFSAVILQSGTSWSPISFGKDPQEKAISLTENLEDKATTSKSIIERLSGVSAEEIVTNELLCIHPDESREHQRGVLPFAPVIEPDHPDAIITKYPEETESIDIPIMIGYNSRETIEKSARFLHKPNYLTFADRDFLFLMPIRTGYRFQLNDKIYFQAIDEIKDYYFDEGYIKISSPGEYLTYMNDISTFYPIDYTVRAYLNISTSSVYYYMFDFSGELNYKKKSILKDAITLDGTWGASLGDELCHLFICNPIRKTYKKLLEEGDSDEIKVLQTMVRLYSNFAKTGNPTPTSETFIWKPATKENKEILVISEDLKMINKLYEDKVMFWDDFLAKYKAMAVNGVVKDSDKDEL